MKLREHQMMLQDHSLFGAQLTQETQGLEIKTISFAQAVSVRRASQKLRQDTKAD